MVPGKKTKKIQNPRQTNPKTILHPYSNGKECNIQKNKCDPNVFQNPIIEKPKLTG
jgi:hypothetical protein